MSEAINREIEAVESELENEAFFQIGEDFIEWRDWKLDQDQ